MVRGGKMKNRILCFSGRAFVRPENRPSSTVRRCPATAQRISVQWLFAVTCLLVPHLASAATLDIYGELTGKTILAPSTLPSLPDSIVSELPAEKTNAIASIESEFSKRGIYVVQDGPSFIRLLPTEKWQAYLTNAPLRGAQLGTSSKQEVFQAGAVNFPATQLTQVLGFYATLKNRTVLRTRFLPQPVVHLKNQCSLTREELTYAFETVLALNGIATVDDGKTFVQIVPIELRSRVNAHAPRPESSARRFDPKKVPAVGQYDLPQPQTKLERDFERWRKAFFEFIRLNNTRDSSAQRLLELYARLTDKAAEPSAEFENSLIWFHVTTPVSKAELAYAIETTFTLNNLSITRVDDERIRLEVNQGPGKKVERPDANPEPKL